MNPFMLMQLAITMMQLNMGQTAQGKAMIKEALDVVQVLGNAIKDKKITGLEGFILLFIYILYVYSIY